MDKERRIGIEGFNGVITENVKDMFSKTKEEAYRPMAYLGKDVYETETKNGTAKYRYAIEIVEVPKGRSLYILNILLEKESLGKKQIEEICDTCGIEADDIMPYDISSTGYRIDLASKIVEKDIDEKDADTLDSLATAAKTIEGLFGFFMDRNVNIEKTGWDYLNEWTSNC